MKVLTIAIPCYNSAAYMNKAIESLLIGSEDIEILIINDGSKDNTSVIADEYEKKYPNIIRAIHKENGGHGDAVNTGLKNASGLYFKVLDSDDWFDTESFKKVLNILRDMINSSKQLDMLIANYVYENVSLEKSKALIIKVQCPKKRYLPGMTWVILKEARIY
jgi:glycosyltransferase involved in cell wall biosynthesis